MDRTPTLAVLLLSTLATLSAPAFGGDVAAGQKTVVTTTRAGTAPVIDGDLGEGVWRDAPEISGFTQSEPDEGTPATQKTVVKIVYDDDAIYFGARMEDTRPVTALLGRRDDGLESDWFRIFLDPQHDGLSGAGFWVNPANVQVDMTLYNDIYDDWSWDAVWDSATKVTPGTGWTAEVRIPYSQLRFPKKESHVWGVMLVRKTVSNNELVRLVHIPKTETGFVSRFADLTGIEGIQPKRSLELMPYGVSRLDLKSRTDPANPFAETSDYRMDGGLDVKYGLTSSLTLTGTINPDFGQVEVDPAVVNLSQFETFFPEKRPFFTEGAAVFRFGNGPARSRWGFNFSSPTYFYSRRIGREPQGASAIGSDYVDAPGETTILAAGKLTGKVGNGWTVGVLDAVTDRETARAATPVGEDFARDRHLVEPLTNYFVSRATKEYGKASRVGLLLSSVNRRLDDELSFLRSDAYLAGIDGYTLFRDKSWLLEWLAVGSLVEGSADAIRRTQTSPAHYYQRPDAGHVELDPTRTSLSGWGGRAMLGKQTGRWRPNLSVQTYSPGFEVNDVGFLQRADTTATHAVIQYVNETVTDRFREKNFWLGKYQNWNLDGDLTANGVYGNWFLQMKNYWYVSGWGGGNAERYDDRKTRGGPLILRVPDGTLGIEGGNDSRKKVYFDVWLERWTSQDGSDSNSVGGELTFRPTPALRLSISPSFNRSQDYAQYVGTFPDPDSPTFGKRYLFATIDQRTLDIGTRVDWTLSSRLSLQLYLQPFIASGDYSEYKVLARGGSADYTPIDPEKLSYDGESNAYRVRTSGSSFRFGNPDFNFRSVRGSAVVRWEFRPGSAIYVVWNENRADVAPVGDFRIRRDFSAIGDAPSHDVFLLKVSYWLPL